MRYSAPSRPRFGRRRSLAVMLTMLLCSPGWSQEPALPVDTSVNPIRPSAPIFWRPYKPVEVPPVRLANSSRFRSLIRGGKLYLTAQDAIALALENNIDIESQRYDTAGWQLERAEAGGALPGVPSASAQTSSVASGQGVLGSQAAAGVKIGTGNTGPGNASNTTVSQVGTVAQTFDPTIQETTTFSHRTVPSANSVNSAVAVLIQGQRTYTGSYTQGFAYGGSATVSYSDHYLNENAPFDLTNPSVFPTLSISIQQNLLQGFGVAVNTRSIRVAKLNIGISDLNFKTLVAQTVVSVLNGYYSLIGNYEDLRAKQDAVETAGRFLAETRRRLELGAAAQLDVTTAQNQISIARQAQANSLAALQQQDLQLKTLISRTGVADPLIATTPIVPLDHLTVPAGDDLPPLKDLVRTALAHRSDLLADQANIRSSEVSAVATENGLLPRAVAFGSKANAGAAGVGHTIESPFGTLTADPYFRGGIGKALGQIFRNNFPSQSIGVFGSVPIHSRQAQADYAIDQLQLRQQQLDAARSANQAQVDMVNAVVALHQARARYEAAVQNRMLEERLVDAEQKKFAVGESTTYNVTQQQRDLINARAAELSAQVSYQAARINIDQTSGTTLEANHISLAEAKEGVVKQQSALPAELPATEPPVRQ
jgi:outer membrane protein